MLVFWIWLSLCGSFCSFADVASWQDRFTSFWWLTALMRNTFLICNHVSMSQTCHESRVISQFLHCREKIFNKPFCVIDTAEVISETVLPALTSSMCVSDSNGAGVCSAGRSEHISYGRSSSERQELRGTAATLSPSGLRLIAAVLRFWAKLQMLCDLILFIYSSYISRKCVQSSICYVIQVILL